MSPRGLTIRYIFALTLVALMSGAILGLSWSATRMSAEDGGLVNQSGRQRMLSQQIALFSYEFVSAEGTAERGRTRDQLETSLQQFITSHNELVLAADMSDRTMNVYQDEQTNLDLAAIEFAHSVGQLLESQGDAAYLQAVRQGARDILPRLEMATNAFTLEAEARAARLEKLEVLAFAVTLIVLGIEAAFIFRPAARSLDRNLKRLRRERERAELANAAKTEFLAQMSHEIRTPLNGVLGMAAALKTARLPKQQKQMVDTISASGDLLLAVVNDILDLSKIEAGQVDFEHTDISLEQIVNWTDSAFRPSAIAKGISFETEVSEDAKGWYLGDPTRIRQILSNLVSNAIKFTETGSVQMRLSADPGETGKTLFKLSVSDTGPGISPQRLEAIFNPFEQEDATTTRRHGGTGLGLPIARRLAELMGGKLLVASELGRGSTFTVHFELAEGTMPKPAALPNQPDSSLPRLKALVVDDVATNRLVLETLLAPLQVDAVCVDSGPAAIHAFIEDEFDIILMDIQMPNMDGVEATRRIRDIEHNRGGAQVPIIAVTANVLPDQVQAYHAAGLDRHLAKPVQPDALRILLQEMRDLTQVAAQ